MDVGRVGRRHQLVIFCANFTTLCRALQSVPIPDCDTRCEDALHIRSVKGSQDGRTEASISQLPQVEALVGLFLEVQ